MEKSELWVGIGTPQANPTVEMEMRHGFSPVPLLIGFILMPLLEENLRTVLLLSSTYHEGILFVFKRPAFLVLLALMGSATAFVLRRRRRLGTLGKADA